MKRGASGIGFANQTISFFDNSNNLNSAYTNSSNFVAGAHDRIIVAGALNLIAGGKINVTFNNGYTPAMGDGFDLLDWGSINLNGFNLGSRFRIGTAAENAAADLILPDISSSGLAYDTSLFASNSVIAVVPEPARTLLLVHRPSRHADALQKMSWRIEIRSGRMNLRSTLSVWGKHPIATTESQF